MYLNNACNALVKKLIPTQRTGNKTGASSKKTTSSLEDSSHLFNLAVSRLKNINEWETISRSGTKYSLRDEKGKNEVKRDPELGDLIRIEIPGPGNQSGGGYDWVKIERIIEQKDMANNCEIFGFRVRPVANPGNTDKAAAQFYKEDATSSFLIVRSDKTVKAIEQGMNEKPNTQSQNIWNKIRNLLVAVLAFSGVANSNWKSLTDGLLEENKKTIRQN